MRQDDLNYFNPLDSLNVEEFLPRYKESLFY